jgi:GDPmannose 4,6-dehydratase
MIKKALVLGVNGQDGSFISEVLLKKGYYVVGLGRQIKSKWIPESVFYKYINLNLANLEELIVTLKTHKPNVVYHVAAIHGSAGFNYEMYWQEAHVINTQVTHAILEYMREDNKEGKLVYVSSSKVFESDGDFINESTRRKSDCIYTVTKNASTDLINYYRTRHDVTGSVIWTFNHESARRSERYFINKLITALAMSKSDKSAITNFSNLDFWCDWGSAKEYMKILVNISESHIGQDFIIATGMQHYARDLVSDLFESHNLDYRKHISEENVIKNILRPPHADISKLSNILHEVPKINIFDLCNEMLENYRFVN